MTSCRYGPTVRIGNWFEDICAQQDHAQDFKAKRDSGELLVEKTRTLFDNFHKEINLEAPKEHVAFGGAVQIMPTQMKICKLITETSHPALSVIINDRVVRQSQHISTECELTVAPSTKPCLRNSFRIVSCDDNDRSKEVLKYGQQFRLTVVDTTEDSGRETLYLYATPKKCDLNTIINTTFNSKKWGEINLPVGLCKASDCGPGKKMPMAYTNWYCRHVKPCKRFETDGSPLPSNKPLVITHMATNRNLAAERVVIQTLFGPEFLVSVQNYRDIYHREQWQNVWMICNGNTQR